MKKRNLFLTLGLALTLGAGVAGGLSLNRGEVKEVSEVKALTSGRIFVQKNDNNMKYTGSKLVAYFFDNDSHNGWGDAVANDGHTYQEYNWNLSFTPTTIIMLRVDGENWKSNDPWKNVWCRTGDVSLSGADVLWMEGNATEGSGWGTYSMETKVMNNSDSKIADLNEYKITTGGDGLEAFGEVELAANQQFYIKKTIDGDKKYNSYTSLDLISSNLSKVGDYIKVTNAADYEFYFNFNANTLYITDPAVAAADEFAQSFLTKTTGYCAGSSAISASVQTELKGEYDALADISGAQEKFYGAEVKRGKGVSYSSFASEALSRYVNMQEEKGYTDFLGLNTHNPAASAYVPVFENNSNNNLSLVIIVVSSIALIAAGSFFVIRRRKEQE